MTLDKHLDPTQFHLNVVLQSSAFNVFVLNFSPEQFYYAIKSTYYGIDVWPQGCTAE